MTKAQILSKKLASKARSFLEKLKKQSVLSHKKKLLDARVGYEKFPDILLFFRLTTKDFRLKKF